MVGAVQTTSRTMRKAEDGYVTCPQPRSSDAMYRAVLPKFSETWPSLKTVKHPSLLNSTT